MRIRGLSVGRTEPRRVVGVGGSSSSGKQEDPLSSSMFSSTATLKSKPSASKSTTPVSHSSSPRHKNHLPVWHSFAESDDSDWVPVDATQHDADADADANSPRGFSGRFIGHAPSESEVDDAVSSLQRVLGSSSNVQLVMSGQVSEDESETDWAEPSLFPVNSIMLQANGSDRFYYAIHLLQTDPSVQRIVKSLSTDEAVWEAVLNNDIVRELRESFSADQELPDGNGNGIANNDPHNTTNVLMWVLNTARAKFMQVIEKITKIVIDLFQHKFSKTAAHTEDSEPLNEKLRTSFMLSIMVLLIVVVSRVHS